MVGSKKLTQLITRSPKGLTMKELETLSKKLGPGVIRMRARVEIRKRKSGKNRL